MEFPDWVQVKEKHYNSFSSFFSVSITFSCLVRHSLEILDVKKYLLSLLQLFA